MSDNVINVAFPKGQKTLEEIQKEAQDHALSNMKFLVQRSSVQEWIKFTPNDLVNEPQFIEGIFQRVCPNGDTLIQCVVQVSHYVERSGNTVEEVIIKPITDATVRSWSAITKIIKGSQEPESSDD